MKKSDKNSAADKKPQEFETALEELESIVEKMETGELSLEQSLSAFEQGIALTQQCNQALKNAEQTVKMLIEKNGEDALVDLEPEAE